MKGTDVACPARSAAVGDDTIQRAGRQRTVAVSNIKIHVTEENESPNFGRLNSETT